MIIQFGAQHDCRSATSTSPRQISSREPIMVMPQRVEYFEHASWVAAACRTPAMGGHWQTCEGCRDRQCIAHSCRHRLCPNCHDAALDDWLLARSLERFPVVYYHITLTLYSSLRLVVSLRAAPFTCGTALDCAESSDGGLRRHAQGSRRSIADTGTESPWWNVGHPGGAATKADTYLSVRRGQSIPAILGCFSNRTALNSALPRGNHTGQGSNLCSVV